ncbi:MAG TPA: aminoglycoside phosphotransferase family protein [Acidimicrobiia bacterium]|nr:aminoglycoside phosphotransferase family protein [Acidimicrobiia bacterium]
MVDLPRLGLGRTAEVYDLGGGRVVKLLRAGFDTGMLEREGDKTRAAHRAGLAAPAAHGAVVIEGRAGQIFDRVDGELMLDEIRARPTRYRSLARVLAEVHASVHAGRSNDLPPLKARLADQIDRADPLEGRLRRVAKDRLLSLADGDSVLHGDFHPGNVMLTGDHPVVIDWLDASRGPPAADVARTSWLLSAPAIEPGTPHRGVLVILVRAFRRRYLRSYRVAGSLDPRSLRDWRLPVLAARLSEGVEHETEPLLAEVDRLAGD